MKLEFVDGSQLCIKDIFGGPRLVDGVMRDTLRIEVDPETISFNDLKAIFENTDNLRKIIGYREVTKDGETSLVKSDIGEGYQIFVTIEDTKRKVKPPIGKLTPDKYEEVYIVTIAQYTYQEYTSTNSIEE